ncbi:hypothetical protein KY314_03485, partial [Candidatus Woesearchaeota archaeon]|nr:hypothetical protein [Candidatus Woesearchaeota archaeon]
MDNLRKRIGGVDIAEYVFEPKPSDQAPEKISQLAQKIEEMGGPEGTNAFPYERKALERLCLEKASLEYATLNLSFLDMVQTIDTEENEKITVPRFAVFPVYSLGKVAICIEYDCVNYCYYTAGQEEEDDEEQQDLPTIFSKHMNRGMKGIKNLDDAWINFNIGDIILPTETRKKIKLAELT